MKDQTPPLIPSNGDNFRRIPAEDEARILREWLRHRESLDACRRPTPFGLEPRR